MSKVLVFGGKVKMMTSNEELRRAQYKQVRHDIIAYAIDNEEMAELLLNDQLSWFAGDNNVIYEFKFVETVGRRFMRVTVSDSEGSSNFNFTDDQWTTIKRFIIAKIK